MHARIDFVCTAFLLCRLFLPAAGKCEGRHSKADSNVPVYLLRIPDQVTNPDGSRSFRLQIFPPIWIQEDSFVRYSVEEGQSIVVACPGSSGVHDTQTGLEFQMPNWQNSFEATCNKGKMVVKDKKGTENFYFLIGNALCNQDPLTHTWTEVDTRRFCRYQTIKCGLQIILDDGILYRWNIIQMCFEPTYKSAIYSLHTWVHDPNRGSRRTCPWNSLNEEDTNTINVLYKNHSRVFHKGHLAPDADILNKALKSCTFKYENAAPQVKGFNTGLWSSLENRVRSVNTEATVITGTSNGAAQLYDPSSNNFLSSFGPEGMVGLRLVRIPYFFWKIVHSRDGNINNFPVLIIGINRSLGFQWDHAIIEQLIIHPCGPPYMIAGLYCPPVQFMLYNFPEIKDAWEYLYGTCEHVS